MNLRSSESSPQIGPLDETIKEMCGGNPAPVHLSAVALVVVEAAGLGVDEPEGRRLAYAELLLGHIHPPVDFSLHVPHHVLPSLQAR